MSREESATLAGPRTGASQGQPPAASSAAKKYVAFFLKAALGAAILTWMARSGKLNWPQIAGALDHWPTLLIILALIYAQVIVTAWRWELLLRAQGIRIGLGTAFRLNMIGSLFSTVIPGAVGGDVMKAYYITQGVATQKAEAVATIVLDRVIGLVGLMMVSGVIGLCNLASLKGNRTLLLMCILSVTGAAVSLAGLFAAVQFGPRLVSRNPSGRIAKLGCRIAAALDGFRQRAAILPSTILVSMLCHACVCYAIFLAMHAINAAPVPIGAFFLATPLGLLATAIPLAPAGIGVGQVAFLSLFQILAPANAHDAVNAFTVFQTLVLFVCVSGLIPYFAYGSRQKKLGISS